MDQRADPNQNSKGLSAAESALLEKDDRGLRVPYYCEENVWRLAYRMTRESPEHHYVVCFISNENKTVAMFHQQAGRDDLDKPIVWDYHVILLRCDLQEGSILAYDIDSRLPYPLQLEHYLRESFTKNKRAFDTEFAPLFRLVPASLYLRYFASDRMHMYNVESHSWNAPPPPYDYILPSPDCNQSVKLEQYLDFNVNTRDYDHNSQCVIPYECLGKILTLDDLINQDMYHLLSFELVRGA